MTLDDAANIARENNPKPKHYRIEAETGVLRRPAPEPDEVAEAIVDLLIKEDHEENKE